MARRLRVRIGNQTAFSARTLLEPFVFALEHGFDAFEWFPDQRDGSRGWNAAELSTTSRAHVRSLAWAYDVRLSVHASPASNLSSAEGRTLLAVDLELAHELGATLFNLHMEPDADLEALAHALVETAQMAEASGLQLCIENTVYTAPEQLNELFERLPPRLRRPIGICFDIGHANLHAGTHNDYLRYLDRLTASIPILQVHAHENHGDRDNHLTLFTGPASKDPSGVVELMKRLMARGATRIILEQWPKPPELLLEARRRLAEILARDVGVEVQPVPRPRPARPLRMWRVLNQRARLALSGVAPARRLRPAGQRQMRP